MQRVKTVLITGGATGIGRATSLLFAQKGFNVAISYNASQDAAYALTEQINADYPHAACFHCDLAYQEEIQALVSTAMDRFGAIDVLVNNAGVAYYGLFQDMTELDMDYVLRINLMGAMLCTQAVLPEMIARKSGCIVNLSSIWGETGASCETVYSASKAAVIGFTKALAAELGPSGIRVNCVAPGVISTRMTGNLSEETMRDLAAASALGRVGTPEDAAKAIWFLASDDASFVTGSVLDVNGGLYA